MKLEAISGILLTLLLISMLIPASSIQPVRAIEEKNPAEFLRMVTTEEVTVSDNGTAQLAILMEIAPSPFAEMYRKLLAVPPDVDVEEEMPIPENTVRTIYSDENATETLISVREEFYKSIEEQQQFSFGFITEIFDSNMVPRSSSNGCRVSINAYASLPIVDITQIGSHYKWEIAIGPKNAIGAAAGSIFNSIELAQLMLESLPGEQLYESFWSTKIELPAKAKLLNHDGIEGLSWKIDFGGGTYMNAIVSLDGRSTIVLDERTVVTEKEYAATPTYLYEAFSDYKSFNIEYLLPHPPSAFSESEKYTERATASTESGDTWSYTWTESWSDSLSQPFTYGPLDAVLTVTASITFSGYVGWNFDLFHGLTRFESWMQLDTSVEVDFEATAAESYSKTWTETFFDWKTTFSFWVGVVPVWADLQITGTGVLSVSAYGQLTVTAGTSASASFTAGVRWTSTGGWEGIFDVSTSTSYYGPTIEADAGVWVRPSVRFRIAFLFYGVAGPYIEFEPYAILTLTCSYPPPHGEWSLAVYLRISAGATFAGWLKDILGLDDWSIILTQPDILIMSWSGSWGPSSISITETLDPSTAQTSSRVHVYGTAMLSDGAPVSHANVIVTITQTSASWTTTTGSNGDYSTYISAPETAGTYTVQVSISTGALSGSTSRTLTVQDLPDQGANYQLHRTTTCKDVQSSYPWDPITETPVFRTSDPTAYTWVHLVDVYVGLNYKFEWYDPDDVFYWSYEDSTDPPPPGDPWPWYKFSAGIYIFGHMPEDMEGRWRCKVYIDEGGGYELVAIEEFVIRYEIISAYRTMAKDVQGGVEDPTPPYDPIDPTDEFLNTDQRALGWIRLDEIAESIELKWEWRDPTGQVDGTFIYTSKDPADEGYLYYTWYKCWGWIDIYGTSRQSKIGTWELRAYIKDVYGNWDLEYSKHFTISDNTPPGTPGTPVDDGDYSTTGNVTWAWTDASEDWVIAKYQIQVGTSPGGNDVFDGYVGIDLTITLSGLKSGYTYYARVRAMNTVGQWGPWSTVSDGITVDRPPMTLFIQGPSGAIDYTDVTFNWTGSDDLTPTPSLVYSYLLEGYDLDWSPWTPSTSRQYSSLLYKEYVFRVRAKDQLGNVDPTGANLSFIIAPYLVRNLDTGLNYTMIQLAIDAPETSDGHTILVDAGTYNESPSIFLKDNITIIGENNTNTIVNGSFSEDSCWNTTYKNLQVTGSIYSGGIDIGSTDHHSIVNCIIHSGISLGGWHNTVKGNIVEGGLILWGGYHVAPGGNVVENNTFLGSGIRMNSGGCDNVITRNTIINATEGVYGHGDMMYRVHDNIITENHFIECETGVHLYGYHPGSIEYNSIIENHFFQLGTGTGVHLFTFNAWINEPDPSYSTISGNIFEGNSYGIFIESGTEVSIYHNSFINNTIHAHTNPLCNNSWDDGYPSGGNYWGDYTGVDDYRGQYQNETGSDGIIDTAYVMDANNTDYYPLLKPYGGPYDIGVASVNCSKTVVGQGYNLTITVKIVNYGISDETFDVIVYANTSIIQTQNITLASRNSTLINFVWNTTGFAYGHYNINGTASTVLGETDTEDNTVVDGTVFVTIPGDVDGDLVVDYDDFILLAGKYGTSEGDDFYDSNVDIDSDGDIDYDDFIVLAGNYGKTV